MTPRNIVLAGAVLLAAGGWRLAAGGWRVCGARGRPGCCESAVNVRVEFDDLVCRSSGYNDDRGPDDYNHQAGHGDHGRPNHDGEVYNDDHPDDDRYEHDNNHGG